MKTHLECIPCFLRQGLDAAKLAGVDKSVQKKIMDDIAQKLPVFDLDVTPPEIARTVYQIVDRYTDGEDVYKKLKVKSNHIAMELYPRLKQVIEKSEDRLLTAIRLAVAGNVIDYGLPHAFDVETEIEECLEKDFGVFDIDNFRRDLAKAERIVYLLDNAGEIVLDKLLIETIDKDITCFVREKPIINDVTMDDARDVGLDKVAKVISSGSDIPGMVPENCTKEFRDHYNNADIIISKGQGNFETLADEKKPIYFIFKAKCAVVANHLGCRLGDIILKKQDV